MRIFDLAATRRATSSERWFRASVLGVAGWLLAGCGPPQIGLANREIVLALATATSAENTEWLDLCVRDIEAAREGGMLPEVEDDAFSAIIELARAGRWEKARDKAYALRDAQEPTPESIEAVRKRTLPAPRQPGPRS